MNRAILPAASLMLLIGASAHGQLTGDSGPANAIDLEALIERAADEIDKEIIYSAQTVPQRFPVVSTLGSGTDYDSLLAVLRSNALIAVETDDQVLILPEAAARTMPTPLLQDDDRSVSDHAYVTRVMTVPDLGLVTPGADGEPGRPADSAAMFVPILRPMIGPNGMLGAVSGTNQLIIVDRYDNVRRITAIIEALVANR